MTKAFEIKTMDSISIGSTLALTDDQCSCLCSLCTQQNQTVDAVLAGRAAVTHSRIDGIGPVVVKAYMRGGLIRHLIKRHYFRLGSTRCQKEFELLQSVRRAGINAPEPIAFAYKGRLYYMNWLITRAIPQPKSLAQLAHTDASVAQQLMPAVITQISKLIQHHIQHIDLHPGNVLVDQDGRVFIIDFDKGRVFSGSRNQLQDLYSQRWQGAVRKHDLPVWLNDMFQAGLGGEAGETITKKQTRND